MSVFSGILYDVSSQPDFVHAEDSEVFSGKLCFVLASSEDGSLLGDLVKVRVGWNVLDGTERR